MKFKMLLICIMTLLFVACGKKEETAKNINLKTEIAENSIFIKTNPVKLTRILNNFIDNLS